MLKIKKREINVLWKTDKKQQQIDNREDTKPQKMKYITGQKDRTSIPVSPPLEGLGGGS